VTASAPEPVRIVVVRYGEDVIGGAESLARQLAHRLAATGREVEVWTTCAVDDATWANVHAPGVSSDGDVVVRRFSVRMTRRPGLFGAISRGFFRMPPALRPESAWLALQGPFAPGMVRALASGPAVATLFVGYLYHPTVRGLPQTPGPRVLLPTAHDELPLRLRCVAGTMAAAGAMWYATDEERELVVRAHPAAQSVPSAVGNVGIDAPADANARRFRQRIGGDGAYLFHGGRTATGKGLEDLLDGAGQLRRRMPGAALVLAGDAGERTSRTGGVVTVGRLDRQAWWDALAGAAAVVVPSFLESLSILALEAWAVGRPVIANGASPVLAAQVARSGGGVVYRGPAGLADAAAALLSDPDAATAMGERGRAFVERHYRWDAVLERFDRLLDEAKRRTP